MLAPPILEDLPAGTQLISGLGVSTILADIDFETYSPAGFIWNEETQKYNPPRGAKKKGLPVVGACVYSEHPEAEVLSLAYNLKNGEGAKVWVPSTCTLPLDLLKHVISGGLLEAWNSSFEYWIWNNICVKKYGFPPLPLSQLRCAAAKSRAHALPGSLDPAGNVMNIKNKKLKEGRRLLEKFSIPRNPTKTNPRHRILLAEDSTDANLLINYNLQDIKAESELSSLTPDLTPDELEFWLCDQRINIRGVAVDCRSIVNCIKIIEQAYIKYNQELRTITNNEVNAASEIQKIRSWMLRQGVDTGNLTADYVTFLLTSNEIPELPANVRRVLEIREAIGSAAVKKLYAMLNQMSSQGRLHDLFIYHSARTGRAAGVGAQPQNFPNSGLNVTDCPSCKKHFIGSIGCPWCGNISNLNPSIEWNNEAVENALEIINTGNLECVELFFGDAVAAVSGCLRGLFIAAPNHDLICSDYKAIEAVVLAALAGEEWRMEVFRTHGMIYEMSASKITGIDFDEFALYKASSGQHHPMRKKVGKVAELASGYGGWIDAWKQFGADEFFTDEEMKTAILAWRKASPAIVNMWGGQLSSTGHSDYFGLEGMAILAVLNPGSEFKYRAISYLMRGDALYCKLPSGRYITYHRPRLMKSDRREGTLALSFEGWNTNPKNGATGWIRMFTYGGKLTENVVQAVARDILSHAIVNLEKNNYPVVLHVHDEIVAEIPEGFGSIEEFEKIMSTLPIWASDWPVKAGGGWRRKRYGK